MSDPREVRELVAAIINAGILPPNYVLSKPLPGMNVRTFNLVVRAHGPLDFDNPVQLKDLGSVSDQDLWGIDKFGEGAMNNLKKALLQLLGPTFWDIGEEEYPAEIRIYSRDTNALLLESTVHYPLRFQVPDFYMKIWVQINTRDGVVRTLGREETK